jgi:hypothetical protein
MVVGLVASLESLVAFHLSRVADDFKTVDAHYSIFNAQKSAPSKRKRSFDISDFENGRSLTKICLCIV